MRLLGKSAIVIGIAGAMALASMTASEARVRHGAAIAAGAAGFAAGAAIGAAASGPAYGYNGYYDPGYAYTGDPAYDSYAYAPGYASYGYSNNYDRGYGYNSNTISPSRERVLEGRDY